MASSPQRLSAPAISKLPLGLLDFLGIKSFGRYPFNFGDQISPTWDLFQHTVNANLSGAVDAAPVALVGAQFNPSTIVVPQDEIWHVPAYGSSNEFVTAAGEAVSGYLAMSQVTNPGGTRTMADLVTIAASARIRSGSVEPYWLPPGAILGAYINSITGAPTQRIRVTFARLKL